MSKYVYPAIFTQEDAGYSINFPGFESCYTSAPTLEEGMVMAEDVLCLTLYGMEERGEPVPQRLDLNAIPVSGNEFVTLIGCDTLEYRKMFDSKAVKKTLTIPAWLNTMAERQGLNFSAALQTELKRELNLS